MVCQAMSIAMTVVLPAPVASFRARRISSGFASRFAFAKCSMNRLPVFAKLWGDFGQPNCCFDRLNLAEEWSKAVEVVVAPVLKKSFGLRRNKPVGGILELPPLVYLISKIVND